MSLPNGNAGSALVPVPAADADNNYSVPDQTSGIPAQSRSGRSDDVATTGSLTLRVRVGNKKADSSGLSRQHILTQVTAGDGAIIGVPGAGGKQRLPVNIALVIDRSGSMEGEPLEYVKRACAYVVDLLGPDDVLSIVTFEETVEVLMPARRVTEPELIKQHLQRILPGNTTNLFDGLYAAGAQVASVPGAASYVSRVLLLTDGEPTAGLKDFPSIVGQVADLKQRGVTVTALGFGPDYNEELMAGIARRSGGNYYYIARPEEIPDVFRKEIEQVLGVTARNPRLTLYLPRACSVRQVLGSDPVMGTRTAEISLGDIERGATISKLWEMELGPRPSGTYRIAQAVLSWEDGTTGRAETAMVNAVVDFVPDPQPAVLGAGVDPVVAQEVAVAMASRDLEKTMMGMRTHQLNVGDVTAALDRTQQLLKTQGRDGAADELAQAAQALRRGSEGDAEKTLIGTIYNLDQGKRH